MKQNIEEKIRNIGGSLIRKYDEDGIVNEGCNGPYDDEETIIRNLSHLIIITSIEILTFNQGQYIATLEKMGKELLHKCDSDGLYTMRRKKGKDTCNGVIGHAWVIEALIYLSKVFSNEKCYILKAIEIAKKHKFDMKINLWKCPRNENAYTDFDLTFNHQLWYAATIYELVNIEPDSELKKEVDCFVQGLNHNLLVHRNGRIVHSIYNSDTFVRKLKNIVKRIVERANELLKKPSHAYKEEGYHIFNIMAFARIYSLSHNPFFESNKLKKVMEYTVSEELFQKLSSDHIELDNSLNFLSKNDEEKKINIYGFPYNVPGFEMMYIMEVMNRFVKNNVAEKYLMKQMEYTYDEKTNKLGKNCHDAVTINYRVYEFYRYLEVKR